MKYVIVDCHTKSQIEGIQIGNVFKQEDMLSPGRYEVANIIVDKKYKTHLQTDCVHQAIALFIAHRNVFIQTNQTFCI